MRPMLRFLLVASFGLATLANGASAGSTEGRAPLQFVRAAKIYTAAATNGNGTVSVFAPGTMVLKDGKVVAVGSDLEPPPGAEVLDLGSQIVMPGVVLSTCSLAGSASGDDSLAAQYRAADGFDRFASYESVLLGGVTTVFLSPGIDRLVSGRGAVAKLGGPDGRARLLVAERDLQLVLGPGSLRPPAKVEFPIPPSSDNPIKPATRQMPTTRLGQLLGLREAVARAGQDPDDPALVALAEALSQRTRLRIHANEAQDLRRAVQVAEELGHTAVLVGAKEGAMVVRELAEAGYPVVVEIGLSWNAPPADRPYSKDAVALHPETAALLRSKGLAVAISTPYGGQPQEVLLSGAVALRGGMSREDAVASLTRVAAEILGVADQVGSLAPGRDADFLVLSGEPFARSSHVQQVFIEGRSVAVRGRRKDRHPRVSATVVRAGTILTAAGEPIHGGAILLQDGKIVGLGHDVAVPPDARIVDAGPDAVITPGFLDGNSQLEFGDDRSSLGLDADLSRIVAHAGDDSLEVARAGITTALLQSYRASTKGSRIVAVKTAGARRADRVVDSLAGIKFAWAGALDPILTADKYRAVLKKGKDYHDKWVKYLEALEKWKEKQAKAKTNGKPVKKEEKKEESEPEDEAHTEQRSDPVTGKWECEVSGGPFPEPQPTTLNLELEGGDVTGTMSSLRGDDAQPVVGTFADGQLNLKLDVDSPFTISIEATIENDKLTGTFSLGGRLTLDINGTRTEKTFTEVTVVAKKKKKDDDGRPEAPDVVPALEPYRRLFAKEVPVLLQADTAIGIHHALKVFVDEYEVELVLLGAEDGRRIVDEIAGKAKGVVVSRDIRVWTDEGYVIPAIEFSRAGLPVGLQSNGGTAARGLPVNAAYAVRQGLDPRTALRALTLDTARMFHIDDRVGSLEEGKDADILVFSGDPFDLSSQLLHVFVNGQEVPAEGKR